MMVAMMLRPQFTVHDMKKLEFRSPCCSFWQHHDFVMRDIRVTKWVDSKVQPHQLRSSCLNSFNIISAIVSLLASEIGSIPENQDTCPCSTCVWWLWDWLSGISCAVMFIGAGPSPHPTNSPGTYGHRSRKPTLCSLLYVLVEPHCESENSYGISLGKVTIVSHGGWVRVESLSCCCGPALWW